MTEQMEEKCPDCHGEGETSWGELGTIGSDCSKCHGTGKAPKADPKLREKKIELYVCSFCDKCYVPKDLDDTDLRWTDWYHYKSNCQALKLLTKQIIALFDDVKKQERQRILGIIESISSIGYPYGGDYKGAIQQALEEEGEL